MDQLKKYIPIIAQSLGFLVVALGIISSMFGGGWGSPSTGTDYLKKTLEENAQATEIENKAE